MKQFKPLYIQTINKGIFNKKIESAFEILRSCTLCPRECKVDRYSGQTGHCKTNQSVYVSSYSPHFGEETPLVGTNGSGTVFFTYCNLLCIFCQNYDISHKGNGEKVSSEKLASIMLDLQNMGCHNINFVTPTHIVPQILSAVKIAADNGLNIPLVYNSGGYDSVETLKLLEGVIDIYMPDFKFWEKDVAEIVCQARNYPEKAKSALIEMHRQVGDLVINENGIAERGLLVRHLVMPKGYAGTRKIMRFIAKEISVNSYVNIMPQYRPCGRAEEIKDISGFPTNNEILGALKIAQEEGIYRIDRPGRRFMIR